MANRKYDYTGIYELVETFSGEMSIMKICETEGLPYRGYMAWRQRQGFESGRKRGLGEPDDKMVELVAMRDSSLSMDPGRTGMGVNVRSVKISFDNGLRLERESMDLETLLEMLNKIRPALCLS